MPRREYEGSPPLKLTSDREWILIAQYALALIAWRWFPGCDVVRKRDQQLLIPRLLFGLYLARQRGKKITKAEACDLMGVDRATTGPKFIKALEAEGLISIGRHPEIDKRKDFLSPTKKLHRLVESELTRLARNLWRAADHLQGLEMVAAIDLEGASDVPSGGPLPDNLLPLDWPPDHIGTSFTTRPRSEPPQ
jgi:DNA-binding MarR family transcriptional regulator